MKALSLIIVLFGVLLFVVIIFGATGLSDRVLSSIVNEEVRLYRQSVASQIRDPEALEAAVTKFRAELVRSYGLDRPWYERLPNMLLRVILLDLGRARLAQTFTGSNVISDIIMERLPNTVILVSTAIAINFLIGIFLGVRVATKPGSRLDRATSFLSAVSYAVPTWWLGILFILVFAFYLRLFPYGGLYSSPPPSDPLMRWLDIIWHATLPITVLVIVNVGLTIYVTRTIVLNIAQEDFVQVARVKGLPEGLVNRRYVMRVAAPPILTNIILGLAGSIGGAILTETVFSWPGMGTLFFEAIVQSDEALILSLVYMFTLVYVVARFVLEVLYMVVDPRVRI
ncbi:MAG: ABC transporter permease [Nitrososphaerota archaeon]|nr:ABC transporter permease [Candidatus Calditenuaceae archaeon]MDW8073326.1 ABC transporter permease [Nitrososphaerota archaeon]